MNVRPMILRFMLRIRDAHQPVEEQVRGVDEHQRQPQALEAPPGICSASSQRITPLSTKMHVRRSPMARWISGRNRRIDATAQAANDAALPTWPLILSVASFTNEAIVQSPVRPQIS